MNTGMRQGLIRFFSAPPMPCPYLAGHLERQVVTMLSGIENPDELHTLLGQSGFRRSYNIAYKPACDNCNACVPVRVRCSDFKRTKSQRRVWNKSSVTSVRVMPPEATGEHYDLFESYQTARHAEGSMSKMTFTDYADMIQETPVDTYLIEFRGENNQLIGAALTDNLQDGMSMVYSFYDPVLESESPGKYFILWHIEQLQKRSLPYLYLGYWIHQSQKMSYKSQFKPIEYLKGETWVDLT